MEQKNSRFNIRLTFQFVFIPNEPEATAAKEKRPETLRGRNLERNQTQKKTHPYLGDTGECEYKSL